MTKKKDQGSEQRKQLRFQPDEFAVAMLDFGEQPEFDPILVGLPLNESNNGCMLVVRVPDKEQIQTHTMVRVKIGKLHPLKGEVRWVKLIDDNLVKIGIMYLE